MATQNSLLARARHTTFCITTTYSATLLIDWPADAVDPTFAAIRELADLPQVERDRIEVFFRTYKDLPHGGDTVRLHGFGDAAEARRLVTDAMRRFAQADGGDGRDPPRAP